jgi:hypothetical protein
MMRVRWLTPSISVVAVLLSLASLSCSGRLDPTTRPRVATTRATGAPWASADTGAASQPGFYPLTAGNRWVYRQEAVVHVFPDSAEPPPAQTSNAAITREILGPTIFDGREYLGELTTTAVDQWYSPLRQDVTGLYELSTILMSGTKAPGHGFRITAPAGRSPAEQAPYERAARRLEERIAAVEASIGRGAAGTLGLRLPPTTAPTEVIRLRYPMEFKTRWPIWNDRRFLSTAVVMGRETLDLPPGPLLGYRIEVVSDALGPRDFVHLWYGTAGFLQEIEHYEIDAVDQNANIIGRYIFDERQWLQSFELVSSRPPLPFPFSPPRRPK